MPYKLWVPGEEVLSAQFNDYVQEQVVATFPTAAARAAALTAPNVGQHTYLVDTGRTEVWTDKTSPPSWQRPWGVPWGAITPLRTFTTVGNIVGVVFIPGSPVALMGHPIGRMVCYHAWFQVSVKSCIIRIGCQRTLATGEDFAFIDCSRVDGNIGFPFTMDPLFAITEPNQQVAFRVTQISGGPGTSSVDRGWGWVEDVGPA